MLQDTNSEDRTEMKSFKQHTEGSFWGRDDLVKKWSTPKKDRHLYIKLAKDDASGHHRASMKRKGNEKKIADLKSQGYKEVPFESYEELQQCIDESLKADIARIASEFPERSTVTYKGKKATVLGNGKDYVKIGIGDETHEVSPNVLKKDTNESEKDTLDESKLTLSTPMYDAIMKMGLPQLMKKHDARVDRKETDKEHTTLSGQRGFGTEVSKLIKQNASKLKKILSEEEVEVDDVSAGKKKKLPKGVKANPDLKGYAYNEKVKEAAESIARFATYDWYGIPKIKGLKEYNEGSCVKEMQKLYASGCAKHEMYEKIKEKYGCSEAKFNELYAQYCGTNEETINEAAMSKPQSIEDYARAVGVNKQEQQWIIDNEDSFNKYHNNSALKKSWLSLSYPIYDNDYYFAFIGDSQTENSKLNSEANRELRKYAKSKLSNEQIYDEMEKMFSMTRYSNVGAGDTMSREELWRAIQHIRRDYREEAQIEGWEELEEKALLGRMKTMARSLLDKMRKRAKKVSLPESLEEKLTDKYGNAKLSDADKDKVGKLRQKIKDHEILAQRLRDEISQIKKAAGVDESVDLEENFSLTDSNLKCVFASPEFKICVSGNDVAIVMDRKVSKGGAMTASGNSIPKNLEGAPITGMADVLHMDKKVFKNVLASMKRASIKV